MSMVLGPIHYWLYAKIGNQKALTNALAEKAQSEGWINDASSYAKELPPLETVIDEGNIHGWLQEQIHEAETRYARLVSGVLSADAKRINALCEAAFAFGKEHALDASCNAQAAYQAFENFFVNGMPCDRINAVTEESADRVSWEMTQDIHAQYWSAYADGSAPYYTLRKSVMDGMLSETVLALQASDNSHYSITKK